MRTLRYGPGRDARGIRRRPVGALIVSLLVALGGVLGAPARAHAVEIASAWYAENEAPVTSATNEFVSFMSLTPIPVAGVQVNGPAASIYVGGPDGAQLVPGTYTAMSVQTDGQPFFHYNWLGCGAYTSTVIVGEASYLPDGRFASVAIDFRSDCTGGSIGHASGAMRFHSTAAVRALVASPAQVNVGDVSTAEPVSTPMTIQNVGTAATAISGLAIAGTAASSWGIDNDACSGSTVAAGASCTVDIVAQPQTGGDLRADLVITSDAFASPQRAAPLNQHGRIATTVSLSIPSGQPTVGSAFYLAATVSPTPDEGIVDVWVDESIYVGRFNYYGTAVGEGIVPGLAAGAHQARAEFYSMSGNATSATAMLDFTVGDTTATTIALSKTKSYSDQTVTATANLTGPVGLTGGTLRIWDVTTSQTLATVVVTPSVHSLSISKKFAAGSHWIVGEYSGAPGFAPSSAGQTLTTLADTGVALVATTPAAQTFYPYKDGYKDTVQVGGTLGEPATVTVAIYRPTGGRIVLASLGSKTGVYRYTWAGRSSTGAMFGAGKYKFVQTLRDATGHVRTATSYVTISGKRLYTYSTYVNMTTPTKRATSWVAWQFTVPSATIYKSLTFQVYGRSVTVPGASIGGWDTRRCAWSASFSPSCVGAWDGLGFSTAWYSKALSPTYNRYGRQVRGFAATSYGTAVVSKARLKVVYGILR